MEIAMGAMTDEDYATVSGGRGINVPINNFPHLATPTFGQ